ncbi:MAG: flagellar export chaperone FliS [Gammaproteobacteria bacterium]|jgi:flagellar protein FliS
MSVPNQASALGRYQSVGTYSAVSAADKLRLVNLMMQGARDRIARARSHLQRREISAKGEQISRAIALVDGLRASLDVSEGGQIARNLEDLYTYMIRRLLSANLNDDEAALDEVANLMAEIQDGWQGVLNQSSGLLSEAK